jgi:hypothetical protein
MHQLEILVCKRCDFMHSACLDQRTCLLSEDRKVDQILNGWDGLLRLADLGVATDEVPPFLGRGRDEGSFSAFFMDEGGNTTASFGEGRLG